MNLDILKLTFAKHNGENLLKLLGKIENKKYKLETNQESIIFYH